MKSNARSVGWKLVKAAVVVGAGAMFVSMWPDLKRYVKIERM
ncbi:MAG TPA: hypothetical protein VN788_08215 [Verrucomicrobiae bacterium]|nr:hypothetical protein [Verrucomicrobiae bacterium]